MLVRLHRSPQHYNVYKGVTAGGITLDQCAFALFQILASELAEQNLHQSKVTTLDVTPLKVVFFQKV